MKQLLPWIEGICQRTMKQRMKELMKLLSILTLVIYSRQKRTNVNIYKIVAASNCYKKEGYPDRIL